mgnify:CR=1 FL=1
MQAKIPHRSAGFLPASFLSTQAGRSIIIGLQESQSYQRFAGRQQEVFPIFQVQICKGRGQKD